MRADRNPQPRIQYATTPHHGSVAFCTLGAGPPLLLVPSGPWTTIAMQWGVPAWHAWNLGLAAHHQLPSYCLRLRDQMPTHAPAVSLCA